jgi:acyl-coenzyme A synthetase/AMP-(fatty) acid ligase
MLAAGAKLDILSALYLGKRQEAMRMVADDPGVLLHEHENASSLWHNVTPLGIAAASGDKELVELFLKNGAPVNGASDTPMRMAMTPLSNALSRHHLEVAEVLLKAGATLNSDWRKWVDQQSDPGIKELIGRHPEARDKE